MAGTVRAKPLRTLVDMENMVMGPGVYAIVHRRIVLEPGYRRMGVDIAGWRDGNA
ncbi:hypothetical protein DSECCO2_609850 [anaerobic digester metagenome]